MVEVFIMRLHGGALSERLMRPIGVVEALEFGQLDVQGADAELAGVEPVELAGLAALARSTQPLQLGLLGGSANSSMPQRQRWAWRSNLRCRRFHR